MKIIIIGPAYPLRGGIAHLNESLCRTFIEEGELSEIVSFSLQYPSFLFPGKTQKEEDKTPSDIIIHSKINSINPINWISSASFIVKKKPDLVIIRYWLPFMAPCLGSIARLIKKAENKIKIISICDNIVPHENRIGDKHLTRYFINSCDAFVLMSKSVQKDLRKFDKIKLSSFIPHPIYDIFGNPVEKEEAQKKLRLNPTDKHILFFGFIRKYKGLDLLISALGKINLRKLNIKLIIAGEFYDSKEDYLKLIRENGLEENIILFPDYIPTNEVKYYFCASDIIVQPYHKATQSGVTQIAYHFARPMLVTNVGGLAEIVKNNRVGYVTETDSNEIATALEDFYINNREKEFSDNAAIDRNNFSWINMVKGIKELFFKV